MSLYSSTFGLWGALRHVRSLLGCAQTSMADTGVVEKLLQRIVKADDGVDSLNVANSLGVDHQVVVGAVKSLQAVGDVSFAGWEAAEVSLSLLMLLVVFDWCNKRAKMKEARRVSNWLVLQV